MTPSATTTLNDELDKVEALGKMKVESLELRDFDFELIAETFANFGVSLNDLSSIAVAVFDHGNAPAGVSDRQFRFDYLDERIKAKNSLSSLHICISFKQYSLKNSDVLHMAWYYFATLRGVRLGLAGDSAG